MSENVHDRDVRTTSVCASMSTMNDDDVVVDEVTTHLDSILDGLHGGG